MTSVPEPARGRAAPFGRRFARNWSFLGGRLGRIWRAGVLARAWQPGRTIVLTTIAVIALAFAMAATIDVAAVSWAKELNGPLRHGFQIITRYGKSDWLLWLSFVVCLVLFCGDWARTTRRRAAAWSEVGTIAGFLFFSVATSGIVLNIVKQFVGRARPRLLPAEGPFSFDPFMFDYAYQSFPSGHAQVMGALAATAIVVAPRYSIVVVLPCLAVAASRVIVSAHYPSDVLAGLALGAGFTWLYAVALAKAGAGFQFRPDGMVVARTSAIRKSGAGAMLAGLWSALAGRPDKSA